MKLFFTVLGLFAVVQLCSSNVLSESGIQEQLLSDKIAVQNGSDVIMVQPGPLEVALNNASELIFKVCSKKCSADFLVCYESDSSDQNILETCDTKCGFYVSATNEDFSFMNPLSILNPGILKSDICFELKMMSRKTTLYLPENEMQIYPSCAPKVESGIVKLNIMNATSECIVSVKNAKIKQDEIIVTSSNSPPKDPTNSPSSNPSSAASKIYENFGWIFAFISFCVFHR